MTKAELRAWIRARAITQAEAAALLGLSLPTLVRQITDAPSGVPVSRQTAIICKLSDELVAIKVTIAYVDVLPT
jgi:hypothetical protein